MDIALSKHVTPEDLQAGLSALLPGRVVHIFQDMADAPWPAFDVAVSIHDNPSEYPCGLSVLVALIDEAGSAAWLRELARQLSIKFACRVICDGSEFGDDNSPFWSIVWDAGDAYLADDCNTIFADGEGGPVKIMRRLPTLETSARPVDLARSVQSRFK